MEAGDAVRMARELDPEYPVARCRYGRLMSMIERVNDHQLSANIIGNYTKKDKITLDYVTKRVYHSFGRVNECLKGRSFTISMLGRNPAVESR